ncbi:6-hydroxy-3-succinoylpyridine 3-monooxygenase HspB (plasmid) [Sulfitobacter sp. THAF37]|uniref:FAD-dependent oxidoreductase n=1 Tax=Sulfitobacter sp. THAF37 TaxID=2587855 RepID=UPI001267AA38|nr:NAD(P)/FAD-dependent oxidoreductase [Sulfitobacter sp. THAF37]QFT60865.1 6-hydroxy-3-succinoylpyridine 3-monooxygenase HspB [Sulfitobacter sp. THAF37]
MKDSVIIVGGGPVGLLTALGLGQKGIEVTVLEAEERPNDSPRALAYPAPILEHFDSLGILEQLKGIGIVKTALDWLVHDTGEFLHMSMDCMKEVSDYPMSLHVGQDKIALVVLDKLAELPNVTVRFSARVKDIAQDQAGVRVTLDDGAEGEVVEGGWLVGCDGASSVVRERVMKTNFFGITWPERFVATNIYFDFEAEGYTATTFQVDHENGAVIVKIDPEGLWRCTYMESEALPVETVGDRIAEKFKTLLPGDGAWTLKQHSPYRMHQRCADTMRDGRIVLAGDAAHITNPTGGLGLTSGVLDSMAVVEVLGQVINDGRDSAILTEYSDDRRRKFIEIASPRASQNKQVVFHMAPGHQREEWLAHMRRASQSPDMLRQMFSFSEQLVSRF